MTPAARRSLGSPWRSKAVRSTYKSRSIRLPWRIRSVTGSGESRLGAREPSSSASPNNKSMAWGELYNQDGGRASALAKASTVETAGSVSPASIASITAPSTPDATANLTTEYCRTFRHACKVRGMLMIIAKKTGPVYHGNRRAGTGACPYQYGLSSGCRGRPPCRPEWRATGLTPPGMPYIPPQLKGRRN